MILCTRGAPATAGPPPIKEELAQTAPSAGPFTAEASSFNQTLKQLTPSEAGDTQAEGESTEPEAAEDGESSADCPPLALPNPALLLAFAPPPPPGGPLALPTGSGDAASPPSPAVAPLSSDTAAAPVFEAQDPARTEKDITAAILPETAYSEAALAAAVTQAGTDRTAGPEPPGTAERVTGPVQAFFREMPSAPGSHEITLTLTPDSLGELNIHVTTTADGGVRAAIIAATPEAKATLETALDGLRQTLAERGLRLQDFSVSLPAPESASGAAAGQMFLANGEQRQGQAAFRPGFAAFRGYRQDDSSVDSLLPLTAPRWSAWDGINLLA